MPHDWGSPGCGFCLPFEKIGHPLPLDDNSISVSLPTWYDVVGYEEANSEVTKHMLVGYPRFKIHVYVTFLNEVYKALERDKLIPSGHTKFSWKTDLKPGVGHTTYTWNSDYYYLLDTTSDIDVLVYPTRAVAIRFCNFMKTNRGDPLGGTNCRYYQCSRTRLYVTIFPAPFFPKAKKFWQHAGEILSSRHAAWALLQLGHELPPVAKNYTALPRWRNELLPRAPAVSKSTESESESDGCHALPIDIVRNRVANMVEEPVTHVHVTVSGMAALFGALRLSQQVTTSVRRSDRSSGGEGGAEVKTEEASVNAPYPFVVFGFSYLDTLKLLERRELNPDGVYFFGRGGCKDLLELEALLQRLREGGGGVSAVFTETPSNPMLKTPDIYRLTALSTEYGFLLVADDTIGGFANLDLLHKPGATVDILCTSLTKAFSGNGNVLGGSLVINSNSQYCAAMEAAISSLELPPLFPEDAVVLEENSRDYEERCLKMDTNAACLASWLKCEDMRESIAWVAHNSVYGGNSAECSLTSTATSSPELAQVPSLQKIESSSNSVTVDELPISKGRTVTVVEDERVSGKKIFESLMRHPPMRVRRAESILADDTWHWTDSADVEDDNEVPHKVSGYGCLLSFGLQPSHNIKVFYDAVSLAKGPSLGSNFTLVSPYVLLAHYGERPWAASFGIPSDLIRISAGLEDISELRKEISEALVAARHSGLWSLLREVVRPRRARLLVLLYSFPL